MPTLIDLETVQQQAIVKQRAETRRVVAAIAQGEEVNPTEYGSVLRMNDWESSDFRAAVEQYRERLKWAEGLQEIRRLESAMEENNKQIDVAHKALMDAQVVYDGIVSPLKAENALHTNKISQLAVGRQRLQASAPVELQTQIRNNAQTLQDIAQREHAANRELAEIEARLNGAQARAARHSGNPEYAQEIREWQVKATLKRKELEVIVKPRAVLLTERDQLEMRLLEP